MTKPITFKRVLNAYRVIFFCISCLLCDAVTACENNSTGNILEYSLSFSEIPFSPSDPAIKRDFCVKGRHLFFVRINFIPKIPFEYKIENRFKRNVYTNEEGIEVDLQPVELSGVVSIEGIGNEALIYKESFRFEVAPHILAASPAKFYSPFKIFSHSNLRIVIELDPQVSRQYIERYGVFNFSIYRPRFYLGPD